MSRRSVQVIHKTVKAAFQLAVDKGQLTRNPGRLASVASEDDAEDRPHWSPPEVGKFLGFMAGRTELPRGNGRDHGRHRGPALGEVCGLRWSTVDLDKGTATIVGQLVGDPRDSKELEFRKTKRPRSKSKLSLHPGTIAALKKRKAQQIQDRLKMGSGWQRRAWQRTLSSHGPTARPLTPRQ